MPDRDARIYQKIAKSLEDDILAGVIREGEPVPSTNRYAEVFEINPATAGRGVSLLAAEGILYKKRGVGMFVAEGARDRILSRRRAVFRSLYLEPFLDEAHRVGISRRDLLAMIMAE